MKDINKRIEELEECEFQIKMSEHLDDSDFAYLDKIRNEIKQLKGLM